VSPSLFAAARLAGSHLLRLQSDRRRVELVAAGNREAFATIVDRYHGELLRHAERVLGPDRAEDALQQALLNAHRALQREGADVADVRPWLHRILRNAALNSLRESGAQDEPLDERLAGDETPEPLPPPRRARLPPAPRRSRGPGPSARRPSGSCAARRPSACAVRPAIRFATERPRTATQTAATAATGTQTPPTTARRTATIRPP